MRRWGGTSDKLHTVHTAQIGAFEEHIETDRSVSRYSVFTKLPRTSIVFASLYLASGKHADAMTGKKPRWNLQSAKF